MSRKQKEYFLKPHGNLVGLKPSQLQRISRLYQRKIAPTEFISASLALALGELSRELNRQLGITIDRRGRVRHVIVGDTEQLFIPDLGRARGGRARFRGVRLIHTHLKDESLTEDDITDLVRLRLDMIAALTLSPFGRPELIHYTHLLPSGGETPHAPICSLPISDLNFNFESFINDLEEEFSRAAVGSIETEGQIRAIAVHVSLGDDLDVGTSLAELNELARTADVLIVDAITQKRKAYDPKFLIGRGKLDELLLRTMQEDCDLVIFDQDLTPNQVRSISQVTDVKVIDRSLLILDIFARRAHTREGKLAVELAQHKYLLPRLAHKNTAYSRLAGGIGGRGPGETKLEIDRRRARERITWLERNLSRTQVQRQNQRARRQNRSIPQVSLIGYTNAGKSTLFNAITQSDVFAENKLFATLHVTSRRLRFPHHQEIVFCDTVGFIRDLPTDLEVAFKATLEELYASDLLLHIVDASDPRLTHQIASVERILTEMDLIDRPRAIILNKIDLLTPTLAENLCTLYNSIGVSALDRNSTRPVLRLLQERLEIDLLSWSSPFEDEFEYAFTLEDDFSEEALDEEVLDEEVLDEEALDEEALDEEVSSLIEDEPFDEESEVLKTTDTLNEELTGLTPPLQLQKRGKWEGEEVEDWWGDD